MNRESMLQNLNAETQWDFIIIGGGATGLGSAIDAATRGFKTLLIEQEDFAKGTSSRSTKLLHGGVRYLAQGNFKLVLEALRERGILLKNAPHVTTNFSFVIPVYQWWELFYYGIGLKMYDFMAGQLGLGKTEIISKIRAGELLPVIRKKNLKAGIVYKDGQFDDTRLAINLAQTAVDNGATVLNYCKVTRLLKENNRVTGVLLTDTISRKDHIAKGTVVINATGVFTDEVLQMDAPGQPSLVHPSQGIHIVLDKSKFPGEDALMIPKTTDGRVLFAVPWHNKVVVGTTDTTLKNISLEPAALESEINFILQNINAYFDTGIKRSDILSVFAGLRPLVKMSSVNKSALMPRDHTILVSPSGLVSITGGKWTTYRKMAKDVVNKAIAVSHLARRDCITETVTIHGCKGNIDKREPLYYYGSDLDKLKELYEENENWKALLHPAFPYTKACVIWAVRYEMAMTAEDVLARRTRMLFLDADAAIITAPVVVQLMAEEMQKDESWILVQTKNFITLAKRYLPSNTTSP